MANTGVCCASLEDPRALMKMGLSMVLIGHVNFLLGALVHGVVLRHINLHKQARAMEYAISNVVALTAGLVGIIVGILAIVLSKNKRNRGLTWSLFTVSLAAALMAAAAAIGLFVSVVRAIIHGGRSLLTHCRFPDAIGYSSITNECPFDPTRIYSTTLILWVPLIVTCVIQMVFSARCFAVCASFLGLPRCKRRNKRDYSRAVNVVRPMEEAPLSHYTEPPRSYDQPLIRYSESPRRSTEPPRSYDEPLTCYTEPLTRYTEPPRSYDKPQSSYNEPLTRYTEPPRRTSAPPRQKHRPPQHRPPQHRPPQRQSLPPSERRPPRQLHTPPEQHQLLERGTLERSSFWI
ncbi:transmembrane protein 54-like isoform X1 [Notolabrus celidotus]|uniref:transmembrane protein 54-like isoform X1 n=1 Tax=Notolabrus celidotus TaxID=1203425 RepID=UPI00149029E0|nr:transmembrane protein 54-like isoform X1 [Notolabrus celidotus]